MCLTGRVMDAAEAERSGLAARVAPADKLEEEAAALAEKIAGFSLPAARLIKESINAAFSGLEDRREGTRAFPEKRKPEWRHR